MLTGRQLDKLGEPGAAEAALSTIADYFGEAYPTKSSENKPLSLLWNRPDRLATVELFILGSCMNKIRSNNDKWLRKTIREIKNCPSKSRGLFTETIYLGMFDMEKSTIEPAPAGNPGYDFSMKFSNGITNYVSVKNIDASDELKEFNRRCRKLRNRWIEKLRIAKANLQLSIVSLTPLSNSDVELALETLKKNPPCRTFQSTERQGLSISYGEIPHQAPLSSLEVSDMVFICCPAPESEKFRYSKRLRQAANNLAMHTAGDSNALRTVFMRMHVNADYAALEEAARSLADDSLEGIDCIIFYQPSYVRNQDNASLLNHFLKVIVSSRFESAMGAQGKTIVNFIIGSASSEPSFVQLSILNPGQKFVLSPSDYVFQQGDIHIHGGVDTQLELNSFAPGVRQHVIVEMNGQSFTIIPKIFPASDELIII